MEWQPIETAPKDADVLLLMRGKFPSVGRWDVQEHHARPRPMWVSERGHLFGKAWDKDGQPTHWMPLPPPPLPKEPAAWGSSHVAHPDYLAEQREKNQEARDLLDGMDPKEPA